MIIQLHTWLTQRPNIKPISMAPAQQNDDVCNAIDTQLKMRLIPDEYKSDNTVTCYENNNTLLQDSTNEKTKSETDFDINKYEAMEFRPRIKWPDLTVQVLLHLVTIYGLYLIITFQVKFFTVLFVFGTIYTSGFGITAGVHRLWSHRAYKANTPLRILLALLFTITGQVSAETCVNYNCPKNSIQPAIL
ncbi:hypothetical protein O3G_MSEX012612 [Manduca sexta]|uniref:Uncharacterized protein n=1 Tax=Manduca sexta TaxID=7130 RepID=A0A922CWW8_MANSE|nr:hypothetical protein O3G_MSEX012612 [Manduca sexta]